MSKDTTCNLQDSIMIPAILFRDRRFERLSVDAKLLYSLLLDRKKIAWKRGWIDGDGTLYVIYPRSEMRSHLNASRYRVDTALAELAACDRMVTVMQREPGKPCQIYVKDLTDAFGCRIRLGKEDDMNLLNKGKADEICRVGCNFGAFLGLSLCRDARKPDGGAMEDISTLIAYLMFLHTNKKYRELRSVFIVFASFYHIDPVYAEGLYSYKGRDLVLYLTSIMSAVLTAFLGEMTQKQV